MARPGGLELPTFWFPPQADSIQLNFGHFAPEFGAILPGLFPSSETFRASLLPSEWKTLLDRAIPSGRDSSSIS
jgi:hypothetical protein